MVSWGISCQIGSNCWIKSATFDDSCNRRPITSQWGWDQAKYCWPRMCLSRMKIIPSDTPYAAGHFSIENKVRDGVRGTDTKRVTEGSQASLCCKFVTNHYQKGPAIKRNDTSAHNTLFCSCVVYNSKDSRAFLAVSRYVFGGCQETVGNETCH